MSSVSKHALIFQNRLLSFEQDIELADIICTAQKAGTFLPDKSLLFGHLDPSKHQSLNTRKPTARSREIVVKHLRATVFSAYIKDIYEELTLYLKSLIYEAALLAKDVSSAKRLLGEHKITFLASDILQFNTLNELTQKIAEDIIQALENERSTKELIKKTCKKISVTIENQVVEEALPYLELRHKLVHTDGKVDEAFQEQYAMFTYDKDGYVVLTYETIVDAKEKISKLVLALDRVAIAKGILMPNTQ